MIRVPAMFFHTSNIHSSYATIHAVDGDLIGRKPYYVTVSSVSLIGGDIVSAS